jgi:2-methylisocitrate lyase-like PEP mutase family enzyme
MSSMLGSTSRTSLHEVIARAVRDRTPVVAPGCFDALSARLVEHAGFEVAYMTGFGTSASLLGRPDVGLLGRSEMVDNARRIAAAISVPLLADADTGYGGTLDVIRTVRDYVGAGVAGLHLEDQMSPKRCGHMDDKQVVDVETMTAKVRAADAAREGHDLVLIARTDARATDGVDEAIRRASAYLDAGADMLFVEALVDLGEIERVAREFAGVPLLFNWAEGGKTPPLTYDEIAGLGFAMIITPIGPLLAATAAMGTHLAALKASGTPAPFVDTLMPFAEFNELIGLPDALDLDARFG